MNKKKIQNQIVAILVSGLIAVSSTACQAKAVVVDGSVSRLSQEQQAPVAPVHDNIVKPQPETQGAQISEQSENGVQLSDQVRFYQNRFQFQGPNQKLVDNVGENHDSLYGARNFREVLRGVLYRGGANNKYNKIEKRNNMNPMPNHGLKNLCQEGFAGAVYLYETNFSGAQKSASCQSFANEDVSGNVFAEKRKSSNVVKYAQMAAFNEANEEKILSVIFDAVTGKTESPLYMHCWNGWHASGLVSAMTLMQFCDWSPEKALQYWIENTDGNSSGYEKVKARIRNFKPYVKFQISAQTKQLVCW